MKTHFFSIRHALALALTVIVLLVANSAWGYRLYTDDVGGGNPKLAKKTYKVYIQANATNPTWRDEVVSALDKWKAELGPRGVDLALQAGDPPKQPLDIRAHSAEVAKYNADPNPDMSKYPEIAKYQAKQDSISVYWDTRQNIQKRGNSDIAGGLANSAWNVDAKGKADTIDLSDIFLPSDPLGGAPEVKAIQIHNVAMHEFAHPAGFEHYTPKQRGEVMQADSSLFDKRINLQPEDTKGLDAIYGAKPQLKIQPSAAQKQVSSLLPEVQAAIPPGIGTVWEYTSDLIWQGGGTASYFQVETGSATVYAALGNDALSDWLVEMPESGERYLEFFADTTYLGSPIVASSLSSFGELLLYSPAAPGTGWLVYAGGSQLGPVPQLVPLPATCALLVIGAISMLIARLLSTGAHAGSGVLSPSSERSEAMGEPTAKATERPAQASLEVASDLSRLEKYRHVRSRRAFRIVHMSNSAMVAGDRREHS